MTTGKWNGTYWHAGTGLARKSSEVSNKGSKTNETARNRTAAVGRDRLIQAVNTTLVELHAKRVAEQGADASGLFSHYAALLKKGAFLRTDEIEAFRLVREALPAYGEYVVLRAGLGELAFLLGGAGLRVIACEPNAARFAALREGMAHFVGLKIVDRQIVRIVCDFVADGFEARPVLGVATDFVFDLPLEENATFCRRLRQLDALLINPRLFIRLRETPSARRAVEAFLHSQGFTEVREFGQQQMVHFIRPSVERRVSVADGRSTASASAMQGFDDVVQRLVSLAPAMPPTRPGTTWVERRSRKFNLRSALDDDE